MKQQGETNSNTSEWLVFTYPRKNLKTSLCKCPCEVEALEQRGEEHPSCGNEAAMP